MICAHAYTCTRADCTCLQVMRMKEKQWTDVIDTNLNGVFYASQAASKVRQPAKGRAR